MPLETVSLKTAPFLKRLIQTVFPEYRKHNCFLTAFHPTQINSYWNGGSRDYFAIVDLETMKIRPMPTSTHPFFEVVQNGLANKHNDVVSVDHVGNVMLNLLPEGFALIRSGIFCGKPGTACIYVNEANLVKCLPAAEVK